jgi:monoamine oxidase
VSANRREFLQRIMMLSGFEASTAGLQMLGLVPMAAHALPILSPDQGAGMHVAVLGAGIAGLVAAYQLERAGFKVTVLEARSRIGGCNWTLRPGSRIQMHGEAEQVADFSAGLYLNAGPSRIPSHHQGVVDYCRILGVPLEVMVNANRNALLSPQQAGSPPMQLRQAINDTRGRLAELLVTAVNRGALDAELTDEHKARLRHFLRVYGDLSDDMTFRGSERSVGAFHADAVSQKKSALALRQILTNDVLKATVYEEILGMQATMLQPVGGMDQLPSAFRRAIASPIIMNANVQEVITKDGKAQVAYLDSNQVIKHLAADYAIVTIPLPVLATIRNDFSRDVQHAITSVTFDHANKTAFESPRFWEHQQIYGGISFAGGETSLVAYPSQGFHEPTGILVTGYNSDEQGTRFARRPVAEQLAMSRDAVERLHTGHGSELAKGIAINWKKIPYSLGAWPLSYRDGKPSNTIDDAAYRILRQPHGCVYFAGAYLSPLPTWQEGAVMSAHHAVDELTTRIRCS